MKTRYKAGDDFIVLHHIKQLNDDVVCDLGHKHSAHYYERKRITIFDIRHEFITALHYTHDGSADVLYAKDAQGRIYRSAPGWDWTAGRYWTRPVDQKLFNIQPYLHSAINFTLDGKRIK